MDILVVIDKIRDAVAASVRGITVDAKLTGEITVKLNVNQGGIRWSEISLDKIKIKSPV